MSKAPPDGLRDRPFLLSVPAGVPFLDSLADGLLDGGLPGRGTPALRGDPLALSDVRIFLPTRRAVRELEAIFAAKLGGAAILPKISALGEFDEDEDAFEPPSGEGSDGLPEALGETERRLALAVLIQGWAKSVARSITSAADEADLISTTPSEAVSLAIELGRLIDSFETEGAKWTEIAPLIPPEHDEVWRITGEFLEIAAKAWPKFLENRGKIGGAARRNLQLRALAARFERDVPTSPVIVAGSTGSNPATADLMQIVARLPNGAVVLHGLDVAADDEAWTAIGGGHEDGLAGAQAWTHPQHAFYRLLQKLGVQRSEVGLVGKEDKARDQRRNLVSTALLPSELTDRWTGRRVSAGPALAGLTLIEAANEREEGLAIALTLVEALRVPGKTAALITPDRPLARRVAAELRRFGIEAEDSAGLPLADSGPGLLARLVAEAAAHQLAPEKLLPLLRHPDARFGLDDAVRLRAVDALEIGVLRGPAPPPGVAGLERALQLARAPANADSARFWHPAKKALGVEDWSAVSALIAQLGAALGPLCDYGAGGHEARLRELLAAHQVALTAVTVGSDADLNRDALDAFFKEALLTEPRVDARLADYPSVFKTLLRGRTARAGRPAHPRLRILGTLEARLLGFDRVVLGGLNENTWPAQAKNDAFLSRPMRGALGLPPPEWRVGLSAHDFEQALGGGDVVLTRSKKAGGAPSVAARWLQRLATVSGVEWDSVTQRGGAYLTMARALDDAPSARRDAPCPKPPRDLRPARLSVTEVETLIRDPYAIYARHVLRLAPLDPVGALPEASDRGTIIHGALAEFVAHHKANAPDAVETLLAIGRKAFETYWDFPDVRALWWPRFERVARWFVDWERNREGIVRTFTESKGALTWDTEAGRPFTLAGRADRLDEMEDGRFAVLDYKTGQPPGDKEVRAGFAPQLPLEAAILQANGFEGLAGSEARDFVYVRLTGQTQAGLDKTIKLEGRSAAEVAAERLGKLKELVNIYEDETTPYRSNTHPKFSRRVNGTYDHLARYAEWSVSPEAEIEEGGEDA